jgi:hypothetical protein
VLRLDNPKQQRTLSEIVAALPDSVRVKPVTRIARVNRLVAEQIKFDNAVASAFDRVLMNAPAETLRPLAKRLKNRIKEISRG